MRTLRDTILIFRRQMRLSLRNPWWLVIGVIQPILYLTLLGPLVKHFISQAGEDSSGAWKIFVPGLLVQLGLFGSMFVGFAVIAEYRSGVIERMRVTPVSRTALLLGRVLRDVVVLVVQSTILLLTGLAMGLRAPLLGVLCSLGFVIALAISMSSLSYALGLALKSEDALAPLLNTVALPMLLLSGIMLPLTRQSAPTWLYDISRVNPFWYIVQAMRACFRADYSNGEVLSGALISVTLAVLCTVLGRRGFDAGAAKGRRRTQDPVVPGLEIAPDPHLVLQPQAWLRDPGSSGVQSGTMLDVMGEVRVRAGEAHAAWSERFNEMFAQVAGEFENAGSRKRARAYVLGLLSHAERKNGWTLAEFAGDLSPDGMQRPLNFYAWDAGAVRDAVRRYVVRSLGDPAGVLVADETGFLKKGTRSAGVARQYAGTAGRVENAQVGVFLAYAAPDGSRALVDRELYLPEKWTADRDRCRAAGIGDEVAFATKPKLAQDMLERAVKAGVPFGWFAADEVYGQNPGLRDWLEDQQIGYVMAVPRSELITVAAGRKRADALARLVPRGAWQRLSCADGSKGPRLYDWALADAGGSGHFLLVRRSLHLNEKGGEELAYFCCYAPRGAALAELVSVAGARWAVEDCYAEAKNETGLDHYQVRLYTAWYRHITLSMLAHAFLAVTAHALRPGPAPPDPPPASADDTEAAKKGPHSLGTNIQH